MRIRLVKIVEPIAVNIKHEKNFSILESWHYNFRLRIGTAGNVPREFIHVWNDDRFGFLPARATHALAQRNTCACDRSLKWPEYQFISLDQIKSDPEKIEGLLKCRCDVGKVGGSIAFTADERYNLRKQFLVAIGFRCRRGDG